MCGCSTHPSVVLYQPIELWEHRDFRVNAFPAMDIGDRLYVLYWELILQQVPYCEHRWLFHLFSSLRTHSTSCLNSWPEWFNYLAELKLSLLWPINAEADSSGILQSLWLASRLGTLHTKKSIAFYWHFKCTYPIIILTRWLTMHCT